MHFVQGAEQKLVFWIRCIIERKFKTQLHPNVGHHNRKFDTY